MENTENATPQKEVVLTSKRFKFKQKPVSDHRLQRVKREATGLGKYLQSFTGDNFVKYKYDAGMERLNFLRCLILRAGLEAKVRLGTLKVVAQREGDDIADLYKKHHGIGE